jgi:hypothetical protein
MQGVREDVREVPIKRLWAVISGRSTVRRPRRAGGFSLIDVVACTAIVTVALLGHAASVISHQTAAKEIGDRGLAQMTLQRFVERMREDSDWAGLYGRLRPLSVESTADTDLTHLGPDLKLTTYAPSTYYADFDAPERLGNVTVLVQVPVGAGSGASLQSLIDSIAQALNLSLGTVTKTKLLSLGASAGVQLDLGGLLGGSGGGSTGAGLYEDTDAPRYGLPADLDGDGFIRGATTTTAYHALPVVVHLRWQHPGRDPQEIVMSTWLRGGW